MAKATLPEQSPSTAVNADQFAMTGVVKDGLIRACGSLKAAAITMEMDQGQLTRDLQSGAFKFERLERLSPREKAIVIGRLHEEYGELSDPKTEARRACDRMQDELNTLRQFVEQVA